MGGHGGCVCWGGVWAWACGFPFWCGVVGGWVGGWVAEGAFAWASSSPGVREDVSQCISGFPNFDDTCCSPSKPTQLPTPSVMGAGAWCGWHGMGLQALNVVGAGARCGCKKMNVSGHEGVCKH
jgi:hypothetical protein